jgi:hypothetical protein
VSESIEEDIKNQIFEEVISINESIMKMKMLTEAHKSEEYLDLKMKIKSMSRLCDPNPELDNISKTGFVSSEMFRKLYQSKVSKDNADQPAIEEGVLKSLMINLKLASEQGDKLFVPILISGNPEQEQEIKNKENEFEENRNAFHLHMKCSNNKSSSELFTVLCTELKHSATFKLCYSKKIEDRKREGLVSGILGEAPDLGIAEYLLVQKTVSRNENYYSYYNQLDIYFRFDADDCENITEVQDYFRGIINKCLDEEKKYQVDIQLRKEKHGKRFFMFKDEKDDEIILTLPLKKSSLQFMLKYKKFTSENERWKWLLEHADFTWLDFLFGESGHGIDGQVEIFGNKEIRTILMNGKSLLKDELLQKIINKYIQTGGPSTEAGGIFSETVKQCMEMIDRESNKKVRSSSKTVFFLL